MLTREEISRKVKRKAAIKKVTLLLIGFLFVLWLLISFLNQREDSVVLTESWQECIPNQCSYKIKVSNTSKLSKSAFVRINAFFKREHPEGADTFHIVNTERLDIYLEQSEEQTFEGIVEVPFEAHFLKFSVGDIEY
ncbi:hypothetical protein RGQ13_15350 [Thalassotalea psychrophila]|uniref:Uncharacterized protein n=1 Tax=Thalassotalea psychrophila TaxID=3065647 RepID=A0ABY9TRR3_9GAMM|nr:hypothetical protein RGQ13_15350 [Colwelliaceae bacterium SQ149]